MAACLQAAAPRKVAWVRWAGAWCMLYHLAWMLYLDTLVMLGPPGLFVLKDMV